MAEPTLTDLERQWYDNILGVSWPDHGDTWPEERSVLRKIKKRMVWLEDEHERLKDALVKIAEGDYQDPYGDYCSHCNAAMEAATAALTSPDVDVAPIDATEEE